MIRSLPILLVSTALSFAGAASALAQEQAPEAPMPSAQTPGTASSARHETGEIVVTAQKRTQNLQEVPISIAVVSGDALDKAGIARFENLGHSIPNFSVAHYAVSDAISIRGINSNSVSASDQAVGTFVDGVYRGRAIQSRFAFMDIERIEVLRGPQGTLFGKNTLAGALNITTAKPTDELDASLQALYEFNHNETDLRGHISGPITDTLRARAAFVFNDMDRGWVYNAANDETMPKKRDWAARGILEWEPIDAVTLTTRYEHGDIEQNGAPIELKVGGPVLAAANALDIPPPSNGVGLYTSVSNRFNPFNTLVPSRIDIPVYSFGGITNELSSQLDVDLGAGVLTALGAYSHYRFERGQDVDFGPLPVASAFDGDRYKQYTAEVRYASDDRQPFYFLIGAFYQREKLFTHFDVAYNTPFLDAFICSGAGAGPGCSGLLAFPNGVETIKNFNQTAVTTALFGQATYKPVESVTITAGLRWGKNKKRARQWAFGRDGVTFSEITDPTQLALMANPAVGIELTPHDLSDRMSDTRWLPQASVRWEITPDISIYTSYAKGDLTGGFNNYASDNDLPALSFDPVSSDNIELGVKAQSPDRRFTLNVTYFNNKFKDLQTVAFTGNSAYTIANAASARSEGVEVEARARLSERFSLGVNGAYNDFRFLSFPNAGCTITQLAAFNGNGSACVAAGTNDQTGRPNIHAPKFTFSANAQYTQPVGDYDLVFAADMEHSSSYYTSADLDPNVKQKPYEKYNASVAFGPRDGWWEIAFVGRNLTNELTFGFGDDTPLFAGAYDIWVDRARTFALRATMKY